MLGESLFLRISVNQLLWGYHEPMVYALIEYVRWRWNVTLDLDPNVGILKMVRYTYIYFKDVVWMQTFNNILDK